MNNYQIYTMGSYDYELDTNKIGKRKYRIWNNIESSSNSFYNSPMFLNTSKYRDLYNGCIIDIDTKQNQSLNKLIEQLKDSNYTITESKYGYKVYCRLTDDEYTIVNKYFNNSMVIRLFNQEHIDILTNKKNGIDYAINNFHLLNDIYDSVKNKTYTFKDYNYYNGYNLDQLLQQRDNNDLFMELIEEINKQSINNNKIIKVIDKIEKDCNKSNIEIFNTTFIKLFNTFVIRKNKNKHYKVDNMNYIWYWLFQNKTHTKTKDNTRFLYRMFLFHTWFNKWEYINSARLKLYVKLFLTHNPYLTPEEKIEEIKRVIKFISSKTYKQTIYDEYNEDNYKTLQYYKWTGYIKDVDTNKYVYKYNELDGKVYSKEEMNNINQLKYVEFIEYHYMQELENGEFNNLIYNDIENKEYKPLRNKTSGHLNYNILKSIFNKELLKDKITNKKIALKLCNNKELSPGYSLYAVINSTSFSIYAVENNKFNLLQSYNMNEIKQDLNNSYELIKKYIKSIYKLKKKIKI